MPRETIQLLIATNNKCIILTKNKTSFNRVDFLFKKNYNDKKAYAIKIKFKINRLKYRAFCLYVLQFILTQKEVKLPLYI